MSVKYRTLSFYLLNFEIAYTIGRSGRMLAYVSIGTLRIIFVARGSRFLSPILGFFEVSIWLIAISQITTNVSNVAAYVAYAAGFAVGNYVGVIIEGKMAIGTLVVRIILTRNDEVLKNSLASAGFGVTSVDRISFQRILFGGRCPKCHTGCFSETCLRIKSAGLTRMIKAYVPGGAVILKHLNPAQIPGLAV